MAPVDAAIATVAFIDGLNCLRIIAPFKVVPLLGSSLKRTLLSCLVLVDHFNPKIDLILVDMDVKWIESVLNGLKAIGASLEPPLPESHIARIEERSELTIPEDLKATLLTATPTGERFPDWHSVDVVTEFMSWVQSGLWFDVTNNALWLNEWGSRPEVIEDKHQDLLRHSLRDAPKLIPIFIHRCLPALPVTAGNAIISVMQSDIVYYGADLLNYVQHESSNVDIDFARIKPIPFWSDQLIDSSV